MVLQYKPDNLCMKVTHLVRMQHIICKQAVQVVSGGSAYLHAYLAMHAVLTTAISEFAMVLITLKTPS